MSDNPMYWPGHQRPAWHQQPPTGQTVNSMSHYANHPGNLLSNPMAPGMPVDSALQMQSSIPGRHQPHQSSLSQHQAPLGPPGSQSGLYPNMMPGSAGPGSARPSMTPNSNLTASNQTMPTHPSMQQPPHPQSHYPHQYSSIASSYWNTAPINSQSALGSSGGVNPPGAPGSAQSHTQPDGTPNYHTSTSPLTMSGEVRGSIPSNTSTAIQQGTSSFHSPKDIQSDHMMSYDRNRGSMTQPPPPQQPSSQHPSMMQQSVPSSTASNLSPTQSQLGMQGRLQSQAQLDSMRSMSQQSGAVSNWSSNYYGQQTQSPYSSVMNPYMPYSGASSVSSHGPTAGQPPTRPPMSQKPSANGSDRARATYPPHAASMYGQPPQPAAGSNGSYYGYESYYNQVASQAPPDPYLSHQTQASAPQHWPNAAPGGNQMISNSSSAPGPVQPPPIRTQTGSGASSIHPQSPSASSTLPTMTSRQPPPSQTPDQSSTSYPSPNQQGSSKTTSNSLAQLEQMVMPGSGQASASSIKSPAQRSSTNSPSANTQQQMQYSYNSSGQGSYFSSTNSGNNSNQSSYYAQYESNNMDANKPGWSNEQGQMINSTGASTGSVMIDSNQAPYNQGGYESSTPFSEYTSLTAPNNCPQPRFTSTGDTSEQTSAEKGDPYAIDSQTFEDFDDPSVSSKTKKSRAKKGDDKVKKERKPRAPRAPKIGNPSAVLASPPPSLQTLQSKPQPLPQAPNMMLESQQTGTSNSYPGSSQQSSMKPNVDTQPQSESLIAPAQPISKSPIQSLTSASPSTQPMVQYPYNSGSQPSYYNQTAPNQPPSYYSSTYDSGVVPSKTWSDQAPDSSMNSSSTLTEPIQTTGPGPYTRSDYDASNQYSSEFTTLTKPSSEKGQDQFVSPPDVQGSRPSETPDTATPDLIQQGEDSEKASVSKTKRRTKKNTEEKVKKEKKPRATKAGKAPLASQSASPLSTTPVQGLAIPSQESYSASPGNAYQSNLGAENVGQVTAESTMDTTIVVPTSPSKSPSQRLSTESPSASNPSQPQYNYGNQPEYLSSGVSHAQHDSENANSFPQAINSLNKDSNVSVGSDGTGPSMTIGDSLPTGDADDTMEASAPVTVKPKKSRVRKKGEPGETTRKRKSRAKVPPPEPSATVQSSSSPQLQENESEQPASQPIPEATASTEPKPKRIRIRDSNSRGKKKLPKFALKFAKTKKRKRLGSSDNDQSDLEKTPPPSPDENEAGVQKRRSARNTKKLKYNDDIALGFSDSDDESQILPKTKKIVSSEAVIDGESNTMEETVIAEEPTVFAAPVEDTMVVEKIMASRMGKRELEPEPGEVLPPDGTMIEVEEFYVKYKNLSYLHCDWRTLEELEKGDRRVAQKLKRYKQKKDSSNLFSFMDEDLFDPQYCEVDRILAVNQVEEWVPVNEEENKQTEVESEGSDKKPEEVPEPNPPPSEAKPTEVAQPISAVDSNETTTPKAEIEKSEISVTGENVSDIPDKSSTQEPKEESPSGELAPSADAKDQIAIDANTESKPETPTEKLPQDIVTEEPKLVKKISRHYLVKWRGLSYEDSTWELEDDLDPDKIKHFERFKDPPPKSKWKIVKRPKPDEWRKKEKSPVYKNSNTLREYQLEGINWLSFCWHQGRNCILADEMGLGKTIQSIAFVNEIYQYGIYGPFLIIVPLSTVGNWAREFETWTDLNVITYHGSSTSREMLKEYEMFYRNDQGNRITSYYKFQVMITTFEIILSDCLDLREIPWRCCIIDEAHRLKNRNCKLLEGLRLLNMEHRVLLTGTPLQNNVEELFSLLNFLEPTQFSSNEQFLQDFGDLKTETQVDKLKEILKPMMLRRLKEDVEKSLAPKEETIVEVELTNIQKKYYRAILEKNFSFLAKGSTSNNMPNLMNTMMELRKCCIHPYLINGAEEQILYEAREARLNGGDSMSSHQAMVNSSGKLVLIDKLLPRLRADGHRVLIFSQMVKCLDILEDYVTHKHYPFERIDGRVRGGDRQQAIDRFSKPGSDRFVFLLCTRAGGLGINLTAADTVIIFDSDWNPQNDLQAQARCHRIGQSKAVKIYRLICRNTYEREMFDKASLKLGLDKAVLQSMNTQKGGPGGMDGQLTKKEIEELLRKGAYGALMDDDNAGDRFCEEDIDQILQRRTQVITIDNSEAKGSTFSKATFSSSNNREDIELDDPNFWEKWAKKANIDSDEVRSQDELIQLAPRRRTQTKRYGADGHLIDMSDLESSEEDEETISMRTRGSRRGQPKLTPSSSSSKRNKRNRLLEYDDDEFLASLEAGYWSKSDCLKVEKGLLTYGWGRWDKIISSNRYKRELNSEDCESICRVMILYCLKNYKGDEKIKSFAWELISPSDEANKSQSDMDTSMTSTRGRKPKSAPVISKRTTAEEIAEAAWTKEAKNDPLIALPDDQYRRHLQRNSNRLLLRARFLHYLKNDILKEYIDNILNDENASEIDLPSVPVDGDLPAPWWDEEADKSLLVGIFKHGHDKFNLIRQDSSLCFLQRCGPPNKDDLLAEMSFADRIAEDLDEDQSKSFSVLNRDLMCPEETAACDFLDDLVNNVVKDLSNSTDPKGESNNNVDINKNNIMKEFNSQDSLDESTFLNGINETSQTNNKIEITDDDSLTNETSVDNSMIVCGAANQIAPIPGAGDDKIKPDGLLPFPSATDLNQRFRRLITAYQRNSKKLEIQLAQKARDDLRKERTSKFEAARHEREERKRNQAQKWSKGHEADFLRAISSYGVDYDPVQRKYDWNKFRSVGKLDKKLDETLEEYYKAFIVMCKKVTNKPLTPEDEACQIIVEPLSEERASRCLSRIELLSKIREQVITHPELDERMKLCLPQSDLPDWWENGIHDKDLLIAAAKHGLTRLDYNLAHDPILCFHQFIRQRVEQLICQSPATKLSIPLEQLQELLKRNGIEYLDIQDDAEDVQAVINQLLDQIEDESLSAEADNGTYKSFVDLVDGPYSKSDEGTNRHMHETGGKATRSSAFAARSLPTILSRRGQANKTPEIPSSNQGSSLRLASLDYSSRMDHKKMVFITPIPPDKLPDDLTKNLEAGDLMVTIQSESAFLQLYDREPIMLFGAANPITLRIRWLRDKAIQTRLENLVYLIENNQWPLPPRPPNTLATQPIPTISLPNPITSSGPTLSITTTSPSKSDKMDTAPLSPGSDISNISSRTSKQDTKERANEQALSTRGRRGRGRKSRHMDGESSSHALLPPQNDHESLKDEGQATAKLRNLLSQGPSSTKGLGQSSDKLTAKFGGNKQGAGLSSLLASFKQKRNEGSGGSRGRDLNIDNSLLDLNAPGTANLLPQILANMKPEFRDLLNNQDTATMILNSLSGLTGAGGIGASLRSSGADPKAALDALLNPDRGSTSSGGATGASGPPPAHQRADGAQSSSGSSRELRRNSQSQRDGSPPSINLRSTRGKSSHASADSGSQAKDSSHGRNMGSKRRGRPSSSTSDSPPGVPGPDVLDLSSLTPNPRSSSSKSELRSRRHRDQLNDDNDETPHKQSSGAPSSRSSKGGSKHDPASSQDPEPQADKQGRTTRASKRIGSRIDALALNLQAKRMNRGDSPSSDHSPSLPKDRSQENPTVAHGSSKSATDSKFGDTKAPPAAHSGSHKAGTSGSSLVNPDAGRDKSKQAATPTSLPSANPLRSDPLSQLMSNPASLLAGLNPGAMPAPGDLVGQLLRKAGSNDIMKNFLNELTKNQGLALDPNLLASMSSSLPLAGLGLPNFNLPQQQVPSTLSSTNPTKTTASSLLNDFKSPSSNSLMKRSRGQESSSSSTRSTSSGQSNSAPIEGRRSSDKHDRRSSSFLPSSSASSTSDRRSNQDRNEKHGKHDSKRSSSVAGQQDSDQSTRRSSSSLLAQQAPTSQPNNIQASSMPASTQPTLPNTSTLNFANQFGALGLNNLGGLLGLPNVSELMKQMSSSFPGLAGASLPRVPQAPVVSSAASTPATNSSVGPSSADKGSRRSRQSSSSSASQIPTSNPSHQQQAANAALANSIMNLASQPNASANPYGNYSNPLANPFLPFNLAGLGMNNPLGMGLFPNLYMPAGFPNPTDPSQQQASSQSSNPMTGSSDNSGSKESKKMRYSRK